MKQKQLYTEGLSDEIKTQVRRIDAATDVSGFVSQPYLMSTGEADQSEGSYCEWIEARKSSNDMWSLKKHTQFMSVSSDKKIKNKNTNEAVRQTKTIVGGLCFFDALYYCAMEEKFRNEQGSIAVSNKQKNLFIKYPLMQAVAKKSFQPFDLNELPIPASDGEILVDGTFQSEALKLAEKSTDTKLLPAKSQESYARDINTLVPTNSFELANKVMGEEKVGTALVRASDFNNVVSKMGNGSTKSHLVLKRATDLMENKKPKFYREWYDYLDERHQEGPFVFGTMVAGLGGLLLGITAVVTASLPIAAVVASPFIINQGLNYNSSFKVQNWRLKRLAKSLPDSQYKSALIDFTKAADANVYYGRVAHMIEQHGILPPRKLKSAFKCIDKASRILELSPLQTNQLKNNLESGNFPRRSEFQIKLAQIYNEVVSHRDSYISNVLKQGGYNTEQVHRITTSWPDSVNEYRLK